MRAKKVFLGMVIVLAAAFASEAEVALDEVVQAGRFVLYRDHADAHKYYYVPDAPRLATKRDGTPEFTFIKYAKTGGETKGGIVHFLVTWGYTSGELSSAEAALKMTDAQARIAGPVPFKEGTFKVVSATAGEGGIFNRRIVGEGKAPIMPGQKAAVSIALSEEGASLLWESFKNPTSDVSVLFALKFAGITPAFQAKLKVNWDKVYTHHDVRLQAEGTIQVVKLKAEMQAVLDDLRQKGVIQLDVVGENENMQKMLDVVYTHILDMMCEKVPMSPGEPMKAVPALTAAKSSIRPDWFSQTLTADFVQMPGASPRGGPYWNQEQAAQTGPPCDVASKARWVALAQMAMAKENGRNYLDAAQKYQEAFAACPMPLTLFRVAVCFDKAQEFKVAQQNYLEFIRISGNDLAEQRSDAAARIGILNISLPLSLSVLAYIREGRSQEAIQACDRIYELTGDLEALYNSAALYYQIAQESGDLAYYEQARDRFYRVAESINNNDAFVLNRRLDDLRWSSLRVLSEVKNAIESLSSNAPTAVPEGQAAETEAARTRQAQEQSTARTDTGIEVTEEARRQRRQESRQEQQQSQTEQSRVAQAQETAGREQTTSAGAQSGGTKPPVTAEGGTKPPAGQAQGSSAPPGQAAQQTTSTQSATSPGTTGGSKPPTGQTAAAGRNARAPEVKPIVSVQLGYTFKRVKLSGNYEVDMRKRLREDRDIVMSGNISGISQKYGEDKRFFTVVSLDDPAFQERSIEVILDGQDASDFKNYINSVSVIFRKQRFSGAPMTGEVKFFDQQFSQGGNRLSFKYGRLNEASTEWLDYEYKPKWSFYGGVEWEGDWMKTSDSVLTLSPPVRRRTLEISVDEDNILKNNVKALALQVKHRIYGREIMKEVVINYDKGDPLQADYTYMHEEGDLEYRYKIVWLFLDGREVHTEWLAKESPFIYAVLAKK